MFSSPNILFLTTSSTLNSNFFLNFKAAKFISWTSETIENDACNINIPKCNLHLQKVGKVNIEKAVIAVNHAKDKDDFKAQKLSTTIAEGNNIIITVKIFKIYFIDLL